MLPTALNRVLQDNMGSAIVNNMGCESGGPGVISSVDHNDLKP